MYLFIHTFVLSAAAAEPLCNHTIDSNDTLHGLVRAGDDLKCISGVATLDGCVSACCGEPQCQSFSYNDPWTLDSPYMGCTKGMPCCCLKDSVPPLEPNKWAMNISTGVVPPRPFQCKSDLDCNLNGDCDTATGQCTCAAAWRADDCGELDLLPAPSLDGAYQTKVDPKDCATSCGPSSWGGLPLKGPDGKYHLFASQFVQNCTLSGWDRGSTVVRAVSDDPFGPYTYAETVFGTFHHNPTVRRLSAAQSGTGKELLVMFMIGSDAPPPTGGGAQCKSNDYNGHHLEGYISMAYADDVMGPWAKVQHAMLSDGDMNRWDAMVTNPSPLFLANGTALLFFRGTQWPVNGQERVGLARAESWKGPYCRLV